MLISWYRSCSVVRSDLRWLVLEVESIFEEEAEEAIDGLDSGEAIFIHRSIHCFQRRASLSVPICKIRTGSSQVPLGLICKPKTKNKCKWIFYKNNIDNYEKNIRFFFRKKTKKSLPRRIELRSRAWQARVLATIRREICWKS